MIERVLFALQLMSYWYAEYDRQRGWLEALKGAGRFPRAEALTRRFALRYKTCGLVEHDRYLNGRIEK